MGWQGGRRAGSGSSSAGGLAVGQGPGLSVTPRSRWAGQQRGLGTGSRVMALLSAQAGLGREARA